MVVVERTMLLLLQLRLPDGCRLATSPLLVWDRVLHGEVLSHLNQVGLLPSSSEYKSAAYAAARAAPCHCDGDMVGASPLVRVPRLTLREKVPSWTRSAWCQSSQRTRAAETTTGQASCCHSQMHGRLWAWAGVK